MTCAIITTIHGSKLKNTTIFVFRCQYLSVTFAKIVIDLKMVEKHKMSKDQQTFIGVTFATIQSILLFHCKTTRKVAKGIKNKIMQLMDMGKLTIMTEKSRDRPISKLPSC